MSERQKQYVDGDQLMRRVLVYSMDRLWNEAIAGSVDRGRFEAIICSDINEFAQLCRPSIPAAAIVDARAATCPESVCVLQKIRRALYGDSPILAVFDSPNSERINAAWSMDVDDILFMPICAETVRVRLEVALRNHACRHSTALSLDQFRKSNEMWAYRVVHNLNNNVSVINACTQLLMKSQTQTFEADAQECLGNIITATEQARCLIRHIFSSAPRTPSPLKELNLATVLGETLDVLQKVLPHQIKLVPQLNMDCAIITGDARDIEELFFNLVQNASDAMPDGGNMTIGLQHVSIDTHLMARTHSVPQGEYVCLSLADNGCGMDGVCLRRLADPFFSTKAPGKGNGLGLHIVREIIKRHGASWRVTSKKGHGTSVFVYFPAILSGVDVSVGESVAEGAENNT